MTDHPATTCPGCDGTKTPRAALCAKCRRRANAVGVSVVTHVHEAAIPTESPEPFVRRTPWQSKAYHGKCNDLARITKADMGETKKKTLAYASERFGRPLESSTELSEVEMELVLEWLTDEIDAAKRRAQLELVKP